MYSFKLKKLVSYFLACRFLKKSPWIIISLGPRLLLYHWDVKISTRYDRGFFYNFYKICLCLQIYHLNILKSYIVFSYWSFCFYYFLFIFFYNNIIITVYILKSYNPLLFKEKKEKYLFLLYEKNFCSCIFIGRLFLIPMGLSLWSIYFSIIKRIYFY